MDNPEPSRLPMPGRWEYGEPSGGEERRSTWSDVRQRLEDSTYYWLSTTRPDGRPHIVPIGGVWLDDRLYLTMSPQTVSFRNFSANPSVTVHLESATEVVIVHGVIERPLPGDVPPTAVENYGAKNEGRWDPEDPEMPFLVVTPRSAMTWTSDDIRGTALRWRFGVPAGES